jgi:hypothetical protein
VPVDSLLATLVLVLLLFLRIRVTPHLGDHNLELLDLLHPLQGTQPHLPPPFHLSRGSSILLLLRSFNRQPIHISSQMEKFQKNVKFLKQQQLLN